MTDPSRLYHAMHRYLADSGVDGVKVDCQVGRGGGAQPRLVRPPYVLIMLPP